MKRQKQYLERIVEERTVELKETNTELEEQKEEILIQKEEISSQRDELENKNVLLVKHQNELEKQKAKIEKAYNNIEIISEFGQQLTSTFNFDDINSMIFSYVSFFGFFKINHLSNELTLHPAGNLYVNLAKLFSVVNGNSS